MLQSSVRAYQFWRVQMVLSRWWVRWPGHEVGLFIYLQSIQNAVLNKLKENFTINSLSKILESWCNVSAFYKSIHLFVTSSNYSRIYETSMSRKTNIQSFFREISTRTFKSPVVTVRLVPGDAHEPGQASWYSYYVRNFKEKYSKLQPLRMRSLCRLQMSATNHIAKRLHIPEERRTQIQSCRRHRSLNI